MMTKRSTQNETKKKKVKTDLRTSIKDELRQLMQPPEWRIELPLVVLKPPIVEKEDSPAVVQPFTAPPPEPVSPKGITELPSSVKELAEIATSLWYLKTKFFKQEWHNEDASDDDPRIRRALGRLNRGIDALKAAGLEVQDPTNNRYPPGSESLMKPVQLVPTAGLTYEKVEDTVVPIIFYEDRLIQRGEVFVAVPMEPSSPSVQPTAITKSSEQTTIESASTVQVAATPNVLPRRKRSTKKEQMN